MLSILTDLAQSQALACIYSAHNSDGGFNVGRVVAADEDFTLIYTESEISSSTRSRGASVTPRRAR